MPLSSPSPREPLHHRAISAHGYRRADGQFEVEGMLEDTKSFDLALMSGARKAGEPLHRMWLRITFDASLTITDAEAASDANPYPGSCESITPAYRQLVGMTMRPGFTGRVREVLGGTAGCTHITDLIGILATTAFQTLAGQIRQDPDKKPFQLDRCHALATDGAAVARYYPRWVRSAAGGADAPLGAGQPSANP